MKLFLQEMENKAAELETTITLTHLATGAALGYLDLRSSMLTTHPLS
jgi:hypothetical protein